MRPNEGVGAGDQPQFSDDGNPAPRTSQTASARGGSSRTPAQLTRAKSAQTRSDRRLNKLRAELFQDDNTDLQTSAPPNSEAEEAASESAAPVPDVVDHRRQTSTSHGLSFSHVNQSGPASTFTAVRTRPGQAVWRRYPQLVPKRVQLDVIRPTPVRLADQAPERGISMLPNLDELQRAMQANRLQPPVMQHSARIAYSGIRASHMVDMAQASSMVQTGASAAHPIDLSDLEDDIE